MAAGTQGRASRTPLTFEEACRFARNLDMPDGMNGCWLWKGRPDRDGYGRFYPRALGGKRYIGVHILAYQRFRSGYDATSQVGHKCGVRNCCNPGHLEMQSKGQNLRERKYPTPMSSAERVRRHRTRKLERPVALEAVKQQIKRHRFTLDELLPVLVDEAPPWELPVEGEEDPIVGGLIHGITCYRNEIHAVVT
jgi:hypothetical protein